jgi:hypothetical protein
VGRWRKPSERDRRRLEEGRADDLVGCLIVLPLYLLAMVATWFVNWTIFRGGWTLHIEVAEHDKRIKVRLKSEEAAVQRLQEVADRVRLEGRAALGSLR